MANIKITALPAYADPVSTDELAAYVTSSAYSTWLNDPSTPAADTPTNGVELIDNGSSDTMIFSGGSNSGSIV